jgi:hypothetical protein
LEERISLGGGTVAEVEELRAALAHLDALDRGRDDDVVEDDVEDRFIARRRGPDRAVTDEEVAERDQAAEEGRR